MAVPAGFGRAIGEIGAVMIVGGNIDHVGRVLTTAIALETSKGNRALALGFIPIFLALLLSGVAHGLGRTEREGRLVRAILPFVERGATVRREGRNIIGPIDPDLSGEGLTAVMGPDGAGKTTLLRMPHQLVWIREGIMEWNVPPEEARGHQPFGGPVKGGTLGRAGGTWQCGWTAGGGAVRGREAEAGIGPCPYTEPDLPFVDEPTSNLEGLSMREIEAILGETRDRGAHGYGYV